MVTEGHRHVHALLSDLPHAVINALNEWKPNLVIQDVLMAELRFLGKWGNVIVKVDTADSAVRKPTVNRIYSELKYSI